MPESWLGALSRACAPWALGIGPRNAAGACLPAEERMLLYIMSHGFWLSTGSPRCTCVFIYVATWVFLLCVFVVCSFMPTGLCACVSVNITLLPPVSQTNHLLTRAPAHPAAQHHSNHDFPAFQVSHLFVLSHVLLSCMFLCCCLLLLCCGGVYLPDVWGSTVEFYQSRIGAVASNSQRGNVKAHRKREKHAWAMESGYCTVVWLRKWLWSQTEWEWLDFLSHSLTVSGIW